MKRILSLAALAAALAIGNGTVNAEADHSPYDTPAALAEPPDPLHDAAMSDAEEGIADANSTWSDAENAAIIDVASTMAVLPPSYAILEEHSSAPPTNTDTSTTSRSTASSATNGNQTYAATPQEELADAKVAWSGTEHEAAVDASASTIAYALPPTNAVIERRTIISPHDNDATGEGIIEPDDNGSSSSFNGNHQAYAATPQEELADAKVAWSGAATTNNDGVTHHGSIRERDDGWANMTTIGSAHGIANPSAHSGVSC